MSDKSLATIGGIVCGIIIFIAFHLGIQLGHIQIKEEAILAGHAEWVADAIGKPQFKWKECK